MSSEHEESLHALFREIIRYHFIRYHKLFCAIGLHRGQPPILELLWKGDGKTQKEIAEALRLKPPTITLLLQRMEKAGLIKRQNDPKDRRSVQIYLTERGKSLQKDVQEIHAILERECFAHFSSEERALLRRLFLQMRDNLQRATEGEER